ncbi:sugar transferase [Roseibium sediminicola]|uniref:Sugar transferase n=1 Tax=Roseibium sediminicola TaxID=2933272 RepID=A0ABT0GNM1_9HYPH|nr:sugar transferase [Roseibium sp. CAU 1639]MCK7611018.1 sugar transferase [Roseibium sp. CAU 1639]
MADETVSYGAEDHSREALNLAGYVVWGGLAAGAIGGTAARRTRRNRPSRALNSAMKKALDLTGATAGLLLLFPLFVAISVAIKATSRGPVLFCQKRYGRNGTPFTVLKFRTMHLHQCDPSGVSQTVANDPRVTTVGSFLRKSNFDELPQLINVLRGDMSLVGPRPHVPGMLAAGVPYETFDPRYMARHEVLPGLTGLAQVSGFRGETKEAYAARMRLECDLAYIRQQSILLDLRIIAATIVNEFFKGRGY